MANLLEIYEDMLQDNQEQHEEALEKTAEDEVTNQRIEVITKYATIADNMLAEEHGKDYTEEDVQELASLLIDNDAEVESQQEKIAEHHQLGIIMARGFKAEMEASQEEEEKEVKKEEK